MKIIDKICYYFSKELRKIIREEICPLLIENNSQMYLVNNEIEERKKNPLYLESYGYKVYSQNDEDGIIEEIFNRIGVTNKIFVEFGLQDGLESNTHFLLHKGWKGLWIEGSEKYCREIAQKFNRPISNGRLVIKNAFINKDNIDGLITDNLPLDIKNDNVIDLLSIDIDGNDYYVWNAIKCVSPRVVVIEYNSKFPANFEWIMEYDAEHIWNGDDEQGASLKALQLLGEKLGYQLVGTSINGINAFFVKKDLAADKFVLPATSENLYNSAKYYNKYRNGHPSKKYIGK